MNSAKLPSCRSEKILSHLSAAERLWLFLDYDGTLADFAPTPEHVEPDPQVLSLLTSLQRFENIRITIISGRRLEHVKALLPLKGVILAGTYGVELQLPSGEQINRLDYTHIRPTLGEIKPQWQNLISGNEGFFLEDKGWSLAIHAKDAGDDQARVVIKQARQVAEKIASPQVYRILGGHKFLEVGPKIANKGKAIDYILEEYPWDNALSVYIGDDDKDEEAFGVIHHHAGLALVVASQGRDTQADCRLESPSQVQGWLQDLPEHIQKDI
jgi:trehalose 6-phosphate phosphatase